MADSDGTPSPSYIKPLLCFMSPKDKITPESTFVFRTARSCAQNMDNPCSKGVYMHLFEQCKPRGFASSLNNPLDLKESPEPPDLEDALANDNTDNKQVPPLDSAVGALGRVTVGALTNNDIALLILDPLQHF